jgi:hypothetical protein
MKPLLRAVLVPMTLVLMVNGVTTSRTNQTAAKIRL